MLQYFGPRLVTNESAVELRIGAATAMIVDVIDARSLVTIPDA